MIKKFNNRSLLILAIGFSLAVITIISIIYYYQGRIIEENKRILQNYKLARVDLTKGLLFSVLSDSDSVTVPFDPQVANTYLNQAIVNFERSLEILHKPAYRNESDSLIVNRFSQNIQVFRKILEARRIEVKRQPKLETELRQVFFQLEKDSEEVGFLLTLRFEKRQARFNSIFLITLLSSAIFLTLLCLFFYFLLKKEFLAQQQLSYTESSYRDLLNNMQNGMVFLEKSLLDNQDYQIIDHNQAFSKMISKTELKGRFLSDLSVIKPFKQTQLFKFIDRVIHEKTMDSEEIFIESFQVWVSVMGYSPAPNQLILILEDINSRKKYEADLLKKNDEYQVLNNEYLHLNEDLQLRISEIKSINSQLEIAKDKAEQSDKLKTAFLQNMSHEIRTPLNAIIGFSDLMSEFIDNREQLLDFANIIQRRGNDLVAIINDILDISMVESGHLSVSEKEVNLLKFAENLLVDIENSPFREEKPDVLFHHSFDKENLNAIVKTDEMRVKQIIFNLLSNSFKFTHKGTVSLQLEFDGMKHLSISVKDTGIGIPEYAKSQIFDRFTKVDKHAPVLYGGLGIGLSIVDGLVNLLGGEISFESKEDAGTEFIVKIPVGKEGVENELDKVNVRKVVFSPDNSVLIVEDDYYSANLLKKILDRFGLKSKISDNGISALNECKSNSYNLILMDIQMPEMDGIQAAKLIKESCPKQIIIAQTAFAFETEKQNILDSGFDDYISKPISADELRNLLSKYLKPMI